MINFFRKKRKSLASENHTFKYLRYAIGEIILVVIGIVIALQINNLNEARKTRIKEKTVLRNLFQDLKSDSISFNNNLITLTRINLLHKKLYEIGINNKMDISIENPNNIRRTLYYNPITKENDPSVANKISNDSLRKEILNYFKLMKDLDDSYGEFDNVIQNRMRIYLGEQGVHILSGWFDNPSINKKAGLPQDIISPDDLITLSKTIEFQQLLFEASIKSTETLSSLELVINQNYKLMNIIKNELEN